MRFSEIFRIILDRRLYGRAFLQNCLPFLVFGVGFQSLVIFMLNRQMLILYVPTAIGVVLISALGAKNFAREFHCIGYQLSLLFLFTSVLAETLTFLLQVENSLYGAFQLLTVFFISITAFSISTSHIAVWGQRVSLRVNAGLTDDFFKEEKKRWGSELGKFPNLNSILDSLDDGRFVSDLFDRGYFNLVVLWSCNVMEAAIDAVADGIISKNPDKVGLFRTEDGRRQNYPRQLKNLGYTPSQEDDNASRSLDEDTLWNKVRNKVAHHNYGPTFHETYGTLTILVSFTNRMPKTLQDWKFS